MELDFIKGHMGGNTILLFNGRQVRRESHVLETALTVLDRKRLYADQAAFLYPSGKANTIRALVVDITNRNFIPACGGFTQVLGKALVDTDLVKWFKVKTAPQEFEVTLELESGPSTVTVHKTKGGKFRKAESDMTSFARMLAGDGVMPVDLDGIQSFKSGYYLVQEAPKLKEHYPEADFEEMNTAAVKAISEAQAFFHQKGYSSTLHFSLFDRSPAHKGHLRAVFPHGVLTGNIEPTCGTGSTALALALLLTGEGKDLGLVKGGRIKVRLETGGGPALGGPDITTVVVEKKGEEVTRAFFSHSLVEITAKGTVFV